MTVDDLDRTEIMGREGEETLAHRSEDPRAASGRTLRPLLPLSGTTSLPRDELRALLHQRLRIILAAAATGFGLLSAMILSDVDPSLSRANVGQGVVLVYSFGVACLVACLVGLLARPNLGLTALRGMELVLIGVAIACLAPIRYVALARGLAGEFGGADFGRYYVPWIAAFNGVGWMACIAGYGVMIPNTRRRATAVVLGMALIPLLTDAALALGHPRIAPFLPCVEIITAVALTGCVPVALFGSFRLTELQGEAAAARREARALNQYQLKRRLGVGGMGEVYLAEHRLLKRPCAIKLIRPDRARDERALLRFEREVQAMARLSHRNSVEIYDYGQADDGTFYYVMEYLPGLGLDQLIARDGPLPPARAVHLLRQVCAALREAHGIGLIHRDIKPSNILVCQYGGVQDVVKLLDFGLVRLATRDESDSQLTRDDHLLGTPDYMSPEQARSIEGLDARSDLYSLGAVAYFLLTGRPPFRARTALDILFAHRHDPVPPPSTFRRDLPADLEAVVLRCLEKDPAHRFPDADRLDEALAVIESKLIVGA